MFDHPKTRRDSSKTVILKIFHMFAHKIAVQRIFGADWGLEIDILSAIQGIFSGILEERRPDWLLSINAKSV